MDSVKTPFPDCIKALCDNIKLDPYFHDFYKWSRENGVPVIVLSSGMTPIIRALLVHLIGPEGNDIEIVSNEVADRPPKHMNEEGGWQIKFHDESGFGHDKSLTIRPYTKYFVEHPNEPRPTMFYAGDGVSDLSAARETDLLFAKKGHGKPTARSVTAAGFQLTSLQTSSPTASAKVFPSQSSRIGNQSSQRSKPYCKLYPIPVCDPEMTAAYRQNNSEGKTSVKQLAAESAEKAKQKD